MTRELQDTDYGSREYSARDLEGLHWHFGTYVPSGRGREPGLGVDRAGVAQALEHGRTAPPTVSPEVTAATRRYGGGP